MQITLLKARTGATWVRGGFALLRSAPIPMLIIMISYMLLMTITMSIPKLDTFASLTFSPLLSVGVIHAIRAIEEKRPLSLMLIFAPFRNHNGRAVWKSLLVVGAVNAIATLLALGIASLLDDGVILDIMSGRLEENDPRLNDDRLVWPILTFLLLDAPIQMALWYAPLFIAWHAMPVGKALFYSLMAVLRNKWVFLNYLFTWMFIGLVTSVVIEVLSAWLAPIASIVLTMISMAIITAFYASCWLSYRDVVKHDVEHSTSLPKETL